MDAKVVVTLTESEWAEINRMVGAFNAALEPLKITVHAIPADLLPDGDEDTSTPLLAAVGSNSGPFYADLRVYGADIRGRPRLGWEVREYRGFPNIVTQDALEAFGVLVGHALAEYVRVALYG